MLACLVLMGSMSAHAQTTYFGVGTNALYDVATMPSISIEASIDQHWSAELNWTSPWWINEDKHNCLEMVNAGIEGRYWLNPCDKQGEWTPFQGHFFGAYGNVGYFDIEHKGDGYQDDFAWTLGVSYGYAWTIGKQFRLLCSIGIGYLRAADYNHYKELTHEGQQYLLTSERGNFSWFGPTKANVSIIWIPQLGRKRISQLGSKKASNPQHVEKGVRP